MCTQVMEWGLLYALQMSKPCTFQELDIKAHYMEVTTANRCDNSFDFAKSKRDKSEFKRNVDFTKNSTKKAMSTFKVEPIRVTEKPKLEEKRAHLSRMQLGGIQRQMSSKRRNTHSLTQICQECLMTFLQKGSFNFRS